MSGGNGWEDIMKIMKKLMENNDEMVNEIKQIIREHKYYNEELKLQKEEIRMMKKEIDNLHKKIEFLVNDKKKLDMENNNKKNVEERIKKFIRKGASISIDKVKEPGNEVKICSKLQPPTVPDLMLLSAVDDNLIKPSISQQEKEEKKFYEGNHNYYYCETLGPQIREWECILCTLLNPPNNHKCATCATVRQKEPVPPTVVKKKVRRSEGENEAKPLHLQLLDLDNGDLVPNSKAFECMICLMEIARGDGVILRECLHQFCKKCLAHTVEFTDDAEIKCPYRDDQYSCDIALQDREIKALVAPNVYEQYLARSVSQVENKIEKSFHCKTPDCKGWCIFEDNVNEFRCPVCESLNCITCQAIHSGMNCKQYQEKINVHSQVGEDAKRTKKMLEEMVQKGEALMCPVCQVILMKKLGCDWILCSMCKTEICWVTKGPRWGPGGRGDTSGGCRCGVNGVKCHRQCNYCH